MKQQRIISGIQQVGIGVVDAKQTFDWYKTHLGFDVIVFADAAEANLMQRYTGGKPHSRYAILALNMQGGGGLEIWQYTSRTPVAKAVPPTIHDLGILAIKIRCRDVQAFYKYCQQAQLNTLCQPQQGLLSKWHFYLKDPWDNLLEIVEDSYWFTEGRTLTGGVCGVTMGVSNLEASIPFYAGSTGTTHVVANETGSFADLKEAFGAGNTFRRSLLTSDATTKGAFSRLMGPYQIELLESSECSNLQVLAGRYWGDLGFIHVCFDINGYPAHEQIINELGKPLTVDSANSFNMGEAAGHFSYNEDPDGALIEYVETHKVPVLKKIGWYFNLKNRNPEKPLPDWMVKCLSFSRVK